ncbi:MAG: hypothetical protein JOZ41_18145 [Chloroflexi bacterium]|nr:hypothetical protein [Chloroflexota bacterium]
MEQRFAFRFSSWMLPFAWLIASGPGQSWVEVTKDEVRVRMGVGFRARIPRRSIARADRHPDMWSAIGIHTRFRGTWIVNGSPSGMVVLDIEPPVRAHTFGIPIRLKRLLVSLEDPEGFLAALKGRPSNWARVLPTRG